MKNWITGSSIQIYRVLSGRSNVFYVRDDEVSLLVDSSVHFEWPMLEKKLTSNPLNIQRLDWLLLTHTHFDHAQNANRIKHRFHCPLIQHVSEAPLLQSGRNPPVLGANRFTRRITDLFNGQLPSLFNYPPASADIWMLDNLPLYPIDYDISIIHTPGHSPGSVSLIVDHEIAIVGDALFGVWPGSVFPPYANDVQRLIQSWKVLLDTGCRLFLPSHGSERTREDLLGAYDHYSRLNLG